MAKRDNKVWADKIISKYDPSFRYRWEIYDELIRKNLTPKTFWIDIGCGDNTVVENLGIKAMFALGVDLKLPESRINAPFVCADIYHLPFRDGIADFTTLRFMVEHLKDIPEAFSEIERILKPNGRVLIITTNLWSPFIFIPRILPFFIKNAIIRILFKVRTIDIQPAYHKFNSLGQIKHSMGNLKLEYLDLIQDANYVRRSLFLIFFFWHLFTKPKFFKFLRTCIVAVFRKIG